MRKHIIGLEQRKSKHTFTQSERFKTTKDTCVYAQRWDPQSCQQLPTTGSQRKFVMATLVSETNPGLHVYVAIYQVSLSRRTLCHPCSPANKPCSQVYKRNRFWQLDRQQKITKTQDTATSVIFIKLRQVVSIGLPDRKNKSYIFTICLSAKRNFFNFLSPTGDTCLVQRVTLAKSNVGLAQAPPRHFHKSNMATC